MTKFAKGKSGNPSGRPRGTSQAAKLRDAIQSDLPEIIGTLVEAAKSGDVHAAKLLLDRSMPAFKPIQVSTQVDGLDGKTLAEQGQAIMTAMGAGNLPPEQTQSMLTALANLAKLHEADEIERRISALEKESK